MKKRNIWLSVAIACVIATGNANSQSLSEAFDNLDVMVNNTSGGTYQGMNGMTTIAGGSMQVRFPTQQNVNLFSVSPPRITAGCGGISAYFGGLSYMSGDQIQELIQNIMAGIPGQLVMLGITQLCPQCADTLKTVLDKIQAMSQFAIDSCQMSASIVSDIASLTSTSSSDTCQNMAATDGDADDVIAARTELCEDSSATWEYLRTQVDATGWGAGSEPEQCKSLVAAITGAANTTWTYLYVMGALKPANDSLAEAILVQSMVGTNVASPKTVGASTMTAVEYHNPVMSEEEAFNLLLCGTNGNDLTVNDLFANTANLPNGTEAALDSINGICNQHTYKILACDDNHNQNPSGCRDVREHTLNETTFASVDMFVTKFNRGLAYNALRVLVEAVRNVRNDQPLAQEAIDLIRVSPFPLYKVINIAAVYPDLASKIITDNAQAIGIILAIAYEKQIIHNMQASKGYVACDIDLSKIHIPVEDVIKDMEDVLDKNLNIVDKLYTRQELIIKQVSQINQFILSDIYNSGAFNPVKK